MHFCFAGTEGVWEKDIGQTIEEKDWDIECDNMFPKCTSLGIHELNFTFLIGYSLHRCVLRRCLSMPQAYVSSVKKIKAHSFIVFGTVTKLCRFGRKYSVIKDLLELNFDMTPALYLLYLNVNRLFKTDAIQ